MIPRKILTPFQDLECLKDFCQSKAGKLNNGETVNPLESYNDTKKYIKDSIFKIKQIALYNKLNEIKPSLELSLSYYTTNPDIIKKLVQMILDNIQAQLKASKSKISYESITKDTQEILNQSKPRKSVEFHHLYMLIKETYVKFAEPIESTYDNVFLEKLNEFDSLLSTSILKTIDEQASYRNKFETELLELLLTRMTPHDFFIKILEVTRLTFDGKNEEARQVLETQKDVLDVVINQWKSDKLPQVVNLIRFDDIKQKYLDTITMQYMSVTLPNHPVDITATMQQEVDEKKLAPSEQPTVISKSKSEVLLRMIEKNQIHSFSISIKAVRNIETLELLKEKLIHDPKKITFFKVVNTEIESLSKSNNFSSIQHKLFNPKTHMLPQAPRLETQLKL